MRRWRKIAVVLTALALAGVLSLVGLLVVDIYVHGRFERSGGFNVWGYRGPSVGRRKPDEFRLIVLGGSTAYGYGVTWEHAMPAAPRSAPSTAAATVPE